MSNEAPVVLSDEAAFALGVRALHLGLRPSVGMRAILCGTTPEGLVGWDPDWIVVRIDLGGEIKTHNGGYYKYPLLGKEIVPDFRDPGTKGHAVAQLRELAGDPGLHVRAADNQHQGGTCRMSWAVLGSGRRMFGDTAGTEEEAVVAAFESIKGVCNA